MAWIGPGGTARSRQHENPSLPNRRSRKPEEIGRRSRRALTHAVAHSQAVSIVHGRLIGSAFATAPVVCLTLAKWETVSGQFGGYLTVRPPPWLARRVGVPVWAKLENQQVTGSFKYRGSLYKGVPNAASREFERCLLRPGFDYPCSTQRV